ncbi:MAG: sulfite exporter TauE/SafE family protein [Deltaproteobacteria bacterium]|nr:sulfite exporter TauE/SafE family protein [Deltaproteobacteria bacterium]
MDTTLLAFCAVVGAGYAIQTVAGFGSMLFCVTVGAQLSSVNEVLTLAVPVSILQSAYILVRDHRHVNWRLLLTRVLPLLALGMALPLTLFNGTEAEGLKPVFGVMVLGLAMRELWLSRRRAGNTKRAPLAPLPFAASTAGAGVVHGIFATGGPLLVYALGRLELSKTSFRATLAVVWLLLNLVLVASFAHAGRYTPEMLRALPFILISLPVGIVIGEVIHHRVDEKLFRKLAWTLLALASIPLILR